VGNIGCGQLSRAIEKNRCLVLRTLSMQSCEVTNCMELAYA
jgi:hypothetical protein